MTMVLPQPSEEERRLLREYRLTNIPSRRSSCSPATSNASSSTTTTTINPKQHNKSSPTSSVGTNNSQTHPSPSPNQSSGITIATTTSNATTTTISTATATTLTLTTPNSNHQPQNNSQGDNKQDRHHHHHSDHHHHHHHKHHHHHHKHHHHSIKSTTPTLELAADELNRMLELVSDLSYLKLVSPKNITTTNTSIATTNGDSDKTEATTLQQPIADVVEVVKAKQQTTTATTTTTTTTNSKTSNNKIDRVMKQKNPSENNSHLTNSIPYIFEKVDYIKKISIRRREMKRVKKAKSKALRVTSPPQEASTKTT